MNFELNTYRILKAIFTKFEKLRQNLNTYLNIYIDATNKLFTYYINPIQDQYIQFLPKVQVFHCWQELQPQLHLRHPSLPLQLLFLQSWVQLHHRHWLRRQRQKLSLSHLLRRHLRDRLDQLLPCPPPFSPLSSFLFPLSLWELDARIHPLNKNNITKIEI